MGRREGVGGRTMIEMEVVGGRWLMVEGSGGD